MFRRSSRSRGVQFSCLQGGQMKTGVPHIHNNWNCKYGSPHSFLHDHMPWSDVLTKVSQSPAHIAAIINNIYIPFFNKHILVRKSIFKVKHYKAKIFRRKTCLRIFIIFTWVRLPHIFLYSGTAEQSLESGGHCMIIYKDQIRENEKAHLLLQFDERKISLNFFQRMH